MLALADPGPVSGDVDIRHGCFSVKMYVKMKEFGAIGGCAPGTPLDPPMVGASDEFIPKGEDDELL